MNHLSNTTEWLHTLKAVVQEHQNNSSFNVESLATICFISRRQLQRRIKKLTGLSPNQYIQESRLQRARMLLESQESPSVKTIAYEVGIRDVKYFSQQFKKRFGRLPSSYFRPSIRFVYDPFGLSDVFPLQA